jgi:hypothetical protein
LAAGGGEVLNRMEATMRAMQICTSVFLTLVAGSVGIPSAIGQNLCRPALTLNQVQFSPIRTPRLQRNWTAVVSVDASRCAPNSHGYFDLVLTRLSENAPDLEVREQLFWSPPKVNVDLTFAADEAVENFRIENVTPCVCRDRSGRVSVGKDAQEESR